MTDKVHKIREEVARIQLYTQSEVLKQVLDYIDEVQKEPVSMWHDASEEPEENKKLLVQYTNYMVEDDYEIDMNIPHIPWRYLVTTYNFKKWCYIEDLLPKGGDK